MTKSATLKALSSAVYLLVYALGLMFLVFGIASFFVDVPVTQQTMKSLLFSTVGLSLILGVRSIAAWENRDD